MPFEEAMKRSNSDPIGLTTDELGNLYVNAAPLAGEDVTNDVIKVEQRYLPLAISAAATTNVKTGTGYLDSLVCVGGTLGAVTVYDNTVASGTVLCPTVTPVAGGILLRHITFSVGLTIVTAAATVLTGAYR